MNCLNINQSLCEFIDGTLPMEKAQLIAHHVNVCEECGRKVEDLRMARLLVRELPRQRVSAQFSERLAQRFAAVPPPSPGTRLMGQMREWIRWNVLGEAGRVLRPALAVSAALITVAAINLRIPMASVPVPPRPVAIAAAAIDPALITQCVTLHRGDTAAQPFTDLAAANLADGMDADAAADAGT